MAASAEWHEARSPRRRKISYHVCAGPCRSHKRPRADHELFLRELIFHFCRSELSARAPFETGHPEVVRRSSPRLPERLHQSDVVPGVIELTVGLGDGPDEFVALERRHTTQCFLARQKMA